MSVSKRSKPEDDSTTSSNSELLEPSEGGDVSYVESFRNTDDEIAGGKQAKSKKTLKRRRRATEPSHFGTTLRSLLNTDAPSSLPLSLKPSVAHQKNDAKLESEARKVIQIERKEREERGRIRDVIGGWGGESERTLRKVAQRGVVKLFNTIQHSQLAAATVEEEAMAIRGTGKPSLPTPSILRKGKRKRKYDEIDLSRVEKKQTDKDAFFDMIRSGGVVSKA